MPREAGLPKHTGPNLLCGDPATQAQLSHPEDNHGLMSAQVRAPLPRGPRAFVAAGICQSQGAQHGAAPGWCPLCHPGSTDTGLAGISLWPGDQAALCHLMLCPAEAGGCCLSRHSTPCWESCPAVTPALGGSTALAGGHCAHSQPGYASGHLQPVCPRAALHLL